MKLEKEDYVKEVKSELGKKEDDKKELQSGTTPIGSTSA
jgi:hypothetical protein